MPGYRALSTSVTGPAADSAREAESRRQDGDPQTAVVLLEEAIEASRHVSSELPGWLCGRLAALYRTLGRYDDEVHLLERYRESQSSEEARSRYDARLSKARTIAERKRRSDSGALSSVRKVIGTPRRRATPRPVTLLPPEPASEPIPPIDVERLHAVLAEPVSSEFEAHLQSVLHQWCAVARESGVAVEQLVTALREVSQSASTTHVTAAERDRRFSTALVNLLAAYFEESDR